MCYFSDGFTDKSYFSMVKLMAEGLYSDTKVDKPLAGFAFRYFEDESVNASAYTGVLGQDCLDMNVGTLSFFFSYMKTAMADDSVLKEIGNPDVETNRIIGGGYDKNKRALLFSGTPIDPKRDSMSLFLSTLAIRFIITHEFGHLFNGHSDFIKKLYAIPKNEMVLKSKIPSMQDSYALDRRTMEMDADACAATYSIDNIIELYKSYDDDAFGYLYAKLDKKSTLFKLWSFSVHSIFLIFEDFAKSDYSPNSYYLPNEARAILAFSAAFNALDNFRKHGIFKCDDEEYKEINKKIIDGILEAERFINRKFGKQYNYIASTTGDTKYVKYSNEVLDYWNNTLRAKLEEYSRTPLYNPKTIDKQIEAYKN